MLSSFLQPASFSPLLANVHSYASEFLHENSNLGFLTNSLLVAGVVVALVLWFAHKATKSMTLIPHKAQNFFEFIVEFLYGQVVGIVGAKIAPRVFPLLATIFIYILVSNWFGLLPGVGTIGWGEGTGLLSVKEVHDPLLRAPTADLNMTFGLSVSMFLVWLYITIKEVGVWGFIVHTFGAKGGLKGVMGAMVGLVFLFVGVIEIFSIVFRPVTLSFRLFGNVLAGENVLHTMSGMGGFIGSVLAPLPFYFMELLVGLLQAIVFTLLSAVYIQLSTSHDDHGHEEAHH
ncbi:F0F1 ATP synthase subunit A [Prosthecobacter sp.]|uniref:F0F1 ATP synthase subunit A n=1 Tax=Prosthecobacter sp. TaxID=1965333 RepID=UPI0024880ACF|nr:F0F1 ATP synthase subunit A [Prosthecobacter sp.]MDI1314762.1 F0F1 ATP synthase subunit A [Prosthecobacter sp.]